MALGWCPTCDTLRPIRKGPQKWGSRECAWYPESHWVSKHIGCGGIVVQEENDWPTCRMCGPVGLDATVSERCTGEKREIK